MTTTLNLKEAAAFLKMKSLNALSGKAARAEVPAFKNGKRWVFIQEDLIDWMRQTYREHKETQERKAKQCHLVNETASTGRDSRTVESEYNALLGLH